ncbi:two-component regulator propeller domain-containing protein [Carboxylicivirga sp. M1479]|uniref:hybrid sensor histidine kinase/response regulator transcription factor n=1 Tax=Carboxylicivirga sp. M1479 TaxID=2594476 RepID=UPI001178BEC2|nr:two-component regulator propeller domain-containing protein [Carboxylicivirga sp. M1479]TRX70299.1 response regulator [Carboxylicivirga sp. M1479]
MRSSKYLLLLFLFSVSIASAQFSQMALSGLDTENGLSNNSVNAILQDSKGYMWFSTYYGLNRYNGYEITNYYSAPDNEETLSSNFITKLVEDNNGDIWVGTCFGLNKYNQNTESFKRYWADETQPASLKNNHVGALLLDSRGHMWVGTMGGGLHYYHEQIDGFTCFSQEESIGEYINTISAIAEGFNGEIWVGTYGNGLSVFNPKEHFFINFEFPTMQINALLDDGNGSIWIATDNMGLFRFDKEMKVYERFQMDPNNSNVNIILSLTLNKDGSILAAVDGGGIINIDPVKKIVISDQEQNQAFSQLDTKAIFSMYIDSNGLYWVGTIGKGIRIINMERNRFQHYVHQPYNQQSISDNNIISLFEDSRKRIWVGTDGGGLNLFDVSNNRFSRFNQLSSNLKSNVIKRIFEDDKNNIWLGTYGSGLAHLNEATNELITFTPRNLFDYESLSISVWSICQQKKGKLWIGTLGNGVMEFDTQNKTFTPLSDIYPQLDQLMNGYILSLFVDSKDNLWIGTSNGIYIWLHNEKKHIRYLFDEENKSINYSGVGRNAILCIHESLDGNFWIGTNGGGIYNINPNSGDIINLTNNDGLAQEQVYDIKQTEEGILWFATQGGISKYEIENGRFQNYDGRDGLLGSTFSALLYTSDQSLMVGGVKGLSVFDPKVIKVNKTVPKVLLSELYINNTPIKAGDKNSPLIQNIASTNEIILKHNQNNIGLEFVAINYFISEKNTYSYVLENSSEQWSKASSNRLVKYNNLSAGEYIFKVKAANNDGVWSNTETSLKITVLAPWWKRWYAYLAYFLVIGGVMYAYIRYTVLWIDLRRKLEFEVMEREKIKELNQMRLQFFTNISHEFRTPLTLISGPLETLSTQLNLNKKEQNLFNIAHKNTNLLLRLINQVMDFRKVETGSIELNASNGDIIAAIKECGESFRYMASEKNMNFVIKSNTKELTIQFDADILEKIIYNLLSNAFKYGKENGNVSLDIHLSSESVLERQKLSIKVSDDGPGIPTDNLQEVFNRFKTYKQADKQKVGTGIGMSLTKSLVELHGGTIDVESSKDKGTSFLVSIPVISNLSNTSYTEFTETISAHNQETETLKETSDPIKKHHYKLLLVDDNPQVIEYLTSVLENTYQITTAENGQKAFDLLEKRSFDLVVSDVMMPIMTGIELCDKMKKDVQTSHIPVILLTAKTSLENSIEGLNTGADAYVPKPFNPDLLKAYIDNLLKNREKLKEIFTGNAIIQPSEITSTSVDEKFITKALEVVRLNMEDEAFGVEELGSELGMSRSNLHRKIKALTNKSTTDFIRTIRLKEAAAKLISTEDQISEIAYKVGFNSSSYFIKSFKKEFNMSPGQYKQAHNRWN